MNQTDQNYNKDTYNIIIFFFIYNIFEIIYFGKIFVQCLCLKLGHSK